MIFREVTPTKFDKNSIII